VYFYELHEGDGDLFHDLLLAHDEEMDPESFFDLVQEIRERVVESFEQETLIAAIAAVLEREHAFEVIWDTRLTAAVNVSRIDEDNFLAEVEDDDDDADSLEEGGSFRTLYAKLEADGDN
jgi:hypothetical protein